VAVAPRESQGVEGSKTVEEVRNPEDGTCRVRQARVKRTLLPMSLKGRQTPGGEPGVFGPLAGGEAEHPERAAEACGSRSSACARTGRTMEDLEVVETTWRER
jgi:hypothetical protein